MTYHDEFLALRREMNTGSFQRMHFLEFTSQHQNRSKSRGAASLNALLDYYLTNHPDSREVICQNQGPAQSANHRFQIPVILPDKEAPIKRIILLFHGLNEKQWDKYLPWASHLAKGTGKAVVLFPLAYHMNRAPAAWSNPRLMRRVLKERLTLFPQLKEGSFANAALSQRLQFFPERFVTSGMQTYFDILKWMDLMRQGQYAIFDRDASLDIFGYSIGALLGQILMMANPNDRFKESRLFLFCGGATLDQTWPVSKAILDSEAAQTLRQFFHTMPAESPRKESVLLRSMLEKDRGRRIRQRRLKTVNARTMALALEKDSVMPPASIKETLRDSGVSTEVRDFAYDYPHENPFPLHGVSAEIVDKAFRKTMNAAVDFLA